MPCLTENGPISAMVPEGLDTYRAVRGQHDGGQVVVRYAMGEVRLADVSADHRGDDGQVLGRQVGGFVVTFPAKEPCAAAVGSTTGSSPSGWGCATAPSSRRCAASGEDHGRCLSWLGEDLGDLFGDQDAPVVVSRVMVRFLEGQRDSGCLGARPHGGNGARPSASSCPRGMPCVKKHTLCTMLTSGA